MCEALHALGGLGQHLLLQERVLHEPLLSHGACRRALRLGVNRLEARRALPEPSEQVSWVGWRVSNRGRVHGLCKGLRDRGLRLKMQVQLVPYVRGQRRA